MSKVCILMNCYNGEKYLQEAIQSVFDQTFSDWTLVFVDNCSTDNSLEIVKSFPAEKIKIVKTEENIPLGAARNFGIKNCDGDYIAFLDTDDIFFPDAIEKLVHEIECSSAELVYGGQININSSGKEIGKMIPVCKTGNLFPKLLKQFDIPIVATIVSKKALVESKLSFDKRITASEEYCLFMQLAARYDISSIEHPVVRYRIHSGALTNKSMSKFSEERRYTLNKIITDFPNFKEKYSAGFEAAYARADYYDAQFYFSMGEMEKAVFSMKKAKKTGGIYIFLDFIIRFPSLWKFFQYVKYRRDFF